MEKVVRRKVRRGDYQSADALVQEAVHRLMEEEDEEELDAIRQRLQSADAEIDQGDFLEYSEHTVKNLANDIHRRGLKRLDHLRKTGTPE